MRLCLLAGLAAVGMTGPAFGGIPIPYGSGHGVTELAPLDPQVQAEAREATKLELTHVGFRYYRFFLFEDGFNFWTSDGEYVLVGGDKGLRVDPEFQGELAAMAGHRKPLAYRLPFGALTVVAALLALWAGLHWSVESRVGRLGRDPRYVAAYQAYTAALPTDRPPTADERTAGLAAGTAVLTDQHGVSAGRAEKNLRLLIKTFEKGASLQMRAAAFAHEEANDLATAAMLFEYAAEYGRFWDKADRAFVLRHFDRVRDKLAAQRAAREAAGPPAGEEGGLG